MFLLRHGQSYFNLHFNRTRVDPGIEDPELTPLGREQAAAAAKRLSDASLTRIIVSPYTRALQTAQPFLGRHGAPTTLLISHWAFILALTGKSVANGEILQYDPAQSPPEGVHLP